ncbi:hypothetical protein D1093_09505 [Bartonella kosoyi]|uniref:Uncharacterized protein n=1 Tax=Bartonella kosoyi TaxID=2133959 RepID=A0A5B9D017_9HYPH|nr:hypothetical protein [Bartonella kosoyi]QEE09787.1 hypothetical protein D1093_09505 [Bartonella kosoyi]
MNIRYFFIAGAITSGLALAIQKSDRIVNQKPSPIVIPYTVEKTHLEFLQQVKSPSDTLDILKINNRQDSINDIHEKAESLLNAITDFLRSILMYLIKCFR